MTRTDVVASSRPQTEHAASIRRVSSRALRGLLALPVALLLAVALVAPTAALAATTTTESGYSQKAPEPKSGTSPSKETKPTKAATTPEKTTTPTTETPKAQTLPFTGFDLRWVAGFGLVLMATGFSIVAVQRRPRRGTDNR
jgi:Alphavirus glycoprotein J